MTAHTTSSVKVDSASPVAESTAFNVALSKTVLMAFALPPVMTPKTVLVITPATSKKAQILASASQAVEKLALNAQKMFGALSANAEESAPRMTFLIASTMNTARVVSVNLAVVALTTSVKKASGVLTTYAWTNARSTMTVATIKSAKVASANPVVKSLTSTALQTKTALIEFALLSVTTTMTVLPITPAILTASASLAVEKSTTSAQKMCGALTTNAEESALNKTFLSAMRTKKCVMVDSVSQDVDLPTTTAIPTRNASMANARNQDVLDRVTVKSTRLVISQMASASQAAEELATFATGSRIASMIQSGALSVFTFQDTTEADELIQMISEALKCLSSVYWQV